MPHQLQSSKVVKGRIKSRIFLLTPTSKQSSKLQGIIRSLVVSREALVIDEALLSIIVCPDTKDELRLASETVTSHVNQLIQEAKLDFVSGTTVNKRVDQLLVRIDGKVAYGVYEGIPNLILEDGILISELDI